MVNPLSFLSLAYRGHLLVEDPRTYEYFSALFVNETSQIQVVPVGGSDGVQGLVNASWQRDARSPIHAFGWTDRDFGLDNIAKWSDRNNHLFRGTFHEIENYLLDWDALSGCELAMRYGKGDVDYRAECHKIANGMLYEVICDHVLYNLRAEYCNGFPSDPSSSKQSVCSRADVENYLINNNWLQGRSNTVGILFSESELKTRIDVAETLYTDALSSTNDDWVKIFPGKEIFEQLRCKVYTGKREKGGCVVDNDLVKSIASYQNLHGVPNELSMFMAELKRRI